MVKKVNWFLQIDEKVKLTKEDWTYIVFDGDLFEIIYDETVFKNSDDIQMIRRWYGSQKW